MKLYASLHTDAPGSQKSHEASYQGYKRIEVDYTPKIGVKEPHLVLFPKMEKTEPDHRPIKYIAFGPEETGDGRLERVIECLPNVNITEGFNVKIAIANIPDPLPADTHPLAVIIWNYINNGDMDVEQLPPEIFKAMNDELERVGAPILKVTRCGIATMNVKFSQVKSLKNMVAA